MQVTLDHIEDAAQNIKTFWFKPERTLRYSAGQFVELTLPHDNADKRGQKRWFTLSSSPTEELLSITTKYFGEASSTFKQALFALQPGATLTMSEAMGDFVLPKNASTELIFVAGGIGVTPMRSMVKDLHDKAEKRTVKLLYAANSPADIAFKDLLASDTQFMPTVNVAPDDWTGETGFLTGERILNFIGDPKDKLIYLSGPEPMIEKLVKDLKDAGINKKAIVTDYFPGYTEI